MGEEEKSEKEKKKGKKGLILAIAAVIVVIVFLLILTMNGSNEVEEEPLPEIEDIDEILGIEEGEGIDAEALAKCLADDKGAVLYVLPTCPYCINQKAAFGESVKYLKIVDCTQEQEICTEQGIQSVPAWIFDDGNIQPLVGEYPLESLAGITGCLQGEIVEEEIMEEETDSKIEIIIPPVRII